MDNPNLLAVPMTVRRAALANMATLQLHLQPDDKRHLLKKSTAIKVKKQL